ncbi:hypothetical protein Acal02_01710 [Acinetobacter calcoaceticus]
MTNLSELGCTCVQMNGREHSFEDRNDKFCPWCIESFKEMDAAHESYIEYGGPEYEEDFEDEDNQVIERPISRKRKRTLEKKGKCVYWSHHLEQYVYVMGE